MAMGPDYLAACYETFLGRDLEDPMVAEGRQHLPKLEVLSSVLRSGEFIEAVLTPVLRGTSLDENLFTDRLTMRQRMWAAGQLPVLQSTAAAALQAHDWRSLLEVLLTDPLLLVTAGLDALPVVRGHPRLQPQAVAARACDVRWESEHSAGFERMLKGFLAPILADFENLGDTCEFGGLQKLAGVERPGLLRWSGVALGTLISLLNCNFHGVDSLSNLSLRAEARDAGPPEFMLDNSALAAASHTFAFPHNSDPQEVLQRERHRLTLLRRKLLEDLSTGGRIFVYATKAAASQADILRLGEAIGRHGPGRLLFVKLADAGLAPGELKPLAPGVAVGALERLALGNERQSELWIPLVMKAHRLMPPAVGYRAAA